MLNPGSVPFKARVGIIPYPSSGKIRQQDWRLPLIHNPRGSHPYLQKEAQPMKANLGLANKGIERILELSAHAHIRRRETVKDSPEFHNLTGAIAAYGQALSFLTVLQQLEEFYAMFGQQDVPAGIAAL